jgi:adenylate cyclase class 1
MLLPNRQADEIDRKALAATRERFLRLQRARLDRVRAALAPPHADFLDILPLLFHVNHPRLPGFAGADVPAGVAGYQPTETTLLCARALARSFRYQRRGLRRAPVQGIYLMGSLGSLGQSAASDLDVWLCHDPQLGSEALTALRAKVARVEDHGRSHGIATHVFLIDVEQFREGRGIGALSEDSSGSTQHMLLLDEFYRSGVHLAGRTPLWWLIPPGAGPDRAAQARRLLEGRFVDPRQWLDFGDLGDLPPHEFFGAAHWQLFKGVDAPYKALLKILLMEAYAAEYPRLQWLSEDLKTAVYAGHEEDLEALDAYVTLYRRVERHLAGTARTERLELARRALYFKADLPLTTFRGVTWKSEALRSLVAGWGWDAAKLHDLDARARWPLERARAERDTLVAELARSHQLLTTFAQRHAPVGAIDPLELSVLARKLYATLERRPGKIDWISLDGNRSLGELRLVLRPIADSGRWQLERGGGSVLKRAESAFEALAWAHVNGVMTRGSRVACESPLARPTRAELQRARVALARHLSPGQRPAVPLEALAKPSRAARALAITNLGQEPLASLAGAGLQVLTARNDPLCFGEARACLVQSVDTLVLTTWGEILVRRHAGPDGVLDALCSYLELSWPPLGTPAELDCHGAGGARAALVARRAESLAHDLLNAFVTYGESLRYLVSVADAHYLIQRDEGRFRWLRASDAVALRELLAEPQTLPRPVLADRGALVGDPLSAVLQPGAAATFRVYSLPLRDRVELYVIDAQGALFHQEIAGAREAYCLVQQRRFLDTLARRHTSASLDAARRWLAGGVLFYRLARAGDGWEATPITVDTTPDHLELTLLTLPGGGFRLACGGDEFDSRVLGETVYDAAALRVLGQRRGDADYPIYLTGILDTGGVGEGRASAMPLLALKRRIEGRLGAAQRRLRGKPRDV